MGIRGKLLDFKRRLSDRRMYSIVVVTIALVAVWGIYQYRNASQLRQELDNQYNRAFYDMVGYVDNVQMLLAKSMISSSLNETAVILEEAWRQANLAQTNLGQLPISQPVLANTSKFLTQVGDLSYSLNNQSIQGKKLNNDQFKTIQKLHGFATSLRNSLADLQSDLGTGRLRWGELAKKGTPLFSKTSKRLTTQQFENIDKTFQSYPSLIYDGPFSDHMTDIKPKALTGKAMNANEAKQSVIKFFGANKVKDVTSTDGNNEDKKDPFRGYSFKVTFKNAPEDQMANISVTQKGGHVLWMLYSRPSEKASLNVDQAKAIGRKFLEGKGYKNMVDTYYLKEDNTATINYAYKQDGVTVYPDLIKLKIALDNGEIVGFESKGFLSSHTERDIPKPVITEAQARELINPRLKIESSGLAIIPTNYRTELFTYEFKGKLDNNDFLVYINAITGKEENILMIINTPNGILTM